ncbi:ATP-binding protein [Clostridium tagluense]|uniref:ATP-binding protein n=1 Tax=Clostridium tagluense TaxID=360422 RepID=UPI001CF26B81|nr:ATP-binding protein [Clostridium tagluense]MCB2297367.1 response regulator [Clostridium tagluense]
MKDSFYKQIIQESSIAYAYHLIICNEKGIPYDYEFIEVNDAFEELTGLIRSEIIGRRVTGVASGVSWSEFNWMELYGDIEVNEDKKEFEQFSKLLNKWYRISVYSPEKNYLITRFNDISKEKGQLHELKNMEEEKENRAAELVIANKELNYQNEEKENRAAELVIANKELNYQNEEKENRAAELAIANKELAYQNEEKENRAAELVIANKELAYQNEEKEKRVAELAIANKELAYQNEEKEKRAAELAIANKELAYQNEEKEKRAAELIIANADLEAEISERKKAGAEINKLNDELEVKISERTYQLEEMNAELGEINATLEEEISEHQRTEVELIKAKGVAEAANKAKSQFLANMSHEIRTPMNGVLGMTQLLGMKLKGENKKMADIVISSGKALLTIINDILDLSKIEAGKVRLGQEKFNINELVNEVNRVLQTLIEKKGLSYKSYIDRTIVNSLTGDPDRLKQVLFNLLGNAIKFTEHGGINLSIVKGKACEDKLQLIFSINDSGIGISKDKIGQLFTYFTQGDDSVTKKYGGTGLGLVISKQLINMMGGEISVESEVGVGSNFVFSSIFNLKVDTEEFPKIHKGDVNLMIPGNSTALLVEDDYVSGLVMKMLCERKNINLQITTSGNQAIEILKNERFDIIFMDIQMPDISGYETTKIFRDMEKEFKSHTPIIATTAFALLGDRQKCIDAGMDDYLEKPIDAEKFYAVVDKHRPRK